MSDLISTNAPTETSDGSSPSKISQTKSSIASNEEVYSLSMKNETENENTNSSSSQSRRDKFIVHLMVGFHEICLVTAAIPLATLFVCFVTAYIFQSEEVHETHCRVYNIIPSISAITGVSPQRYFWRICIALHIGPRFPIAAVYRNYYRAHLSNIKDDIDGKKKGNFLINLVFWLHLAEIAALCGVTYISNKENYPIHEKLFIIFMTVSLCHMLATIKLYEFLHTSDIITEKQEASLKWKKILFAISITGTILLVLFFLKHRLLCHEMAFSWFALSEYIIASANMAFHCTTMLDFPCEQLLIAYGKPEKLKKHIHSVIDEKID